MADNKINDAHAAVEATDRGLFDFVNKKEDSEVCKTPEAEVASGVEKLHVSEPQFTEEEEEEEKHVGLLQKKLHRSDSSTSSSSDEEGDDEEKKKKRKEKKEKKAGLKDKPQGQGDTSVPIENEAEEKKGGFLDKIKDKLPGKTKSDDHQVVAAPAPAPVTEPCVDGDKEKKGFLDKIKEKIPGFSPKSDAHQENKDHD